MRYLTYFITTIIFSISFCNSAIAQTDSLLVHQIRLYVNHIDSINNLDYAQDKGFMKSVVDGIIKRNDKVVGGCGIYTLSNLKGDTVYRIHYHDNLDINTYKTYYFKENKLVYGTLELKNMDSLATTFFKKEEFYNEGKVVFKSLEQNPKRYIDMVKFSLLEDAKSFFARFTKNNF
ncbi:hypothetical protein [Pinibacter aurantiacus]|uniref:DUF4468 domain-containing protein n=1 Tax=Pinibacter aurantiacus TaxID=2851599 RepID=A0A9E2SF59_9BACT|nr:hypothetical protein [Pinibacter aurantiacus]MBV4360517.1 hypothetical protein [Pinibacter aurantiacus]